MEVRRKRRAPRSVPLGLRLLAFAAVIGAAVLVTLPTIHFEFLTSWDDPTYIIDNPWIRGWTRENLTYVFTQPYFANFLPLHLVSYMLDYSLWGLNPFGYHLQSVLLNALNAALALLVVRQIFGNFLLAFLAALLFAVHPAHVEAVAWISIRKDLLSTTFLLLTVYSYLRATSSRTLRRGPYLASVVFFTLGLLSKVSIVTLPLFLLLLDRFQTQGRRETSWKLALATQIPYALVGLWLTRLNSLAQVKATVAYSQDSLQYLLVKGHAVWNYLWLLTGIPRGRPVYDTPQFSADPLPALANLAGILALPALLTIAYRRQWRALTLGAGWVFVLLLPAILFPLVTYMADRYLYAPSLGFCWIVAASLVWLSGRLGSAPSRAVAALGLTLIPLAGFAYRTVEYNRVWVNSEAVWSYAITRSKDYRVHNNLAQVRANQKRWDEAERLYKRAAEFENIVSYQGLAAVYYGTQSYAEAEEAIDKAFEVVAKKGADPVDLAELEYTRGAIYWVRSQPQRAIEAWEAALRANPHHERSREWLRTARGQQASPR
jgi:tetratricopeptide (TPR) repeat protein